MEYITFTINGIHCTACTTLIKMELEEAGFNLVEVDAKTHTLSVPTNQLDSLSRIRDVIASAGDYSISE